MRESDDLVDALVQTSFTVTAALSRLGAAHDLSLTQLRVLAILRDRRVRISALADYLGLDRSTLTGLVDRAEKRGLVRRAPSATDGRSVEVFLTAAGRRLTGRLTTAMTDALGPMTENLTAADTHRLKVLLRRLLTA